MSTEKELLSAFKELREALFDCNQSKLIELISDEYQGFSLNGTVERKEDILQAYMPGSVELSEYIIEDMKCEVIADFGIITGKGKIEGKYREYTFQHEVLFTDIFKFIGERWLYYKSQATEIKSA